MTISLPPAAVAALAFAGWLTFTAPTPAQQRSPALSPTEQAIVTRLRGLRAVPDSQRPAVTRQLALDIRNLPAGGARVRLASGLAGLSTEGDFGHGTLEEVAHTLADALRQEPASTAGPYQELAELVRYEHVQVTLESPQMSSALTKLEADDQDRAHAGFTLEDLNGKSWTLHDLQGKVVLLNFWATWCPPCRKEMPDLDALYREFQNQGLVILAISDEDASKVKPFLAAHGVSYPILLDPGRKVNERFHIEGIPKSFVYNRSGKLVAQSIDMRTRGQFLSMLKEAGLLVGDISRH